MKCDCAERIGIEINSYKFFIELKEFFEGQVQKGIFEDVPVEEPYYIGYSEVQTHYTGMLINGTDAMHAERYGNFNILIFRQQEK